MKVVVVLNNKKVVVIENVKRVRHYITVGGRSVTEICHYNGITYNDVKQVSYIKYYDDDIHLITVRD